MEISATLVRELRDRTQAGMMECKRALVASNGDIESAILEMRKAGHAKAEKKSGRTAAEGRVDILCSATAKEGVIVEVNCETDFVAREQKFKNFSEQTLAQALKLGSKPEALALVRAEMEPLRLELVAQLGENIHIRRLHYAQIEDGVVGSYLHGGEGARIAVMVVLKAGTAEIARDLAMHIAAMSPEYLTGDQIPAERLDKERAVAEAEFEKGAQPAHLRDSIVTGKLKKFMNSVALIDQPYVKDPSKTIKAFLVANQAVVDHFVRFEVGEGIEKKVDDFVTEVMAQARA
jgi:elongation factor Ts